MQAVKPVYTYENALQDHEWLAENGLDLHDQYRGEWVAICFQEVIAHDQDFTKVAAIADEMQISPLYADFPEEETIVYAIG